jgi:hypothetical protein
VGNHAAFGRLPWGSITNFRATPLSNSASPSGAAVIDPLPERIHEFWIVNAAHLDLTWTQIDDAAIAGHDQITDLGNSWLQGA